MTEKPDALLVIDIQKGFMRNGAELLVEPIAKLVRRWPTENVFYLRYRNYPDSLYARHLDWHDFIAGDNINLMPEVYLDGAPVFEHYGYRPPDELIAQLKNFRAVHICGVDTDACVMAAVFALWDAEIQPVILANYCMSSGGIQFHRAALDLMLRQFGAKCVQHGPQ